MTASETDIYRNQAESKRVFEQPHCLGIFEPHPEWEDIVDE